MKRSAAVLGAVLAGTLLTPSAHADDRDSEPADLAITINQNEFPAHRGGPPAHVAFALRNKGPATATDAVVRVNLPEGVSFVRLVRQPMFETTCVPVTGGAECTFASLPPTSGFRVDLEVRVARETPLQVPPMTASVTSAAPDPVPDDNQSSAPFVISSLTTDLELTDVTVPSSAKEGEYVKIRAQVTNKGPADISTGSVKMRASGPFSFYWGSGDRHEIDYPIHHLSPGASTTIEVDGLIELDIDPATVPIDVEVSNTHYDPDLSNNSMHREMQVSRYTADAGLAMTGTETVRPGSELTYRATVRNNGPDHMVAGELDIPLDPTLRDVTITPDPGKSCWALQPGSRWSVGCRLADLSPGQSFGVTIRGKVPADALPGTLVTTGAVTGNGRRDPDTANNTVTVRTTVEQVADLGTVIEGPTSVKPGEQVGYTVTASNNGVHRAQDATLTIGLPAALTELTAPGCTREGATLTCAMGDLPAGESRKFALGGRVPVHTAPGSQDLTARVTSRSVDPGPTANDARVPVAVASAADLALTLRAPAETRRGARVTYEAQVHNRGGDTAPGTTLTFRLPAGMVYAAVPSGCTGQGAQLACRLGDVPAGASRTLKVDGKVGADVPFGRRLETVAEVTSAVVDPVPSDNARLARTTVVRPPSADVAVTGKVGPLRKGRTGTYTLTVTNKGPQAARDVLVAGRLPQGLTFKAVRGCRRDANGIRCTIASLAPGATVTLTVTVSVARNATGVLTYVVSAKPATPTDPAPANNTVRISRKVTA